MPKPYKEHYFFSNQNRSIFDYYLNAIQDAQIPKYSSPYSKKRYNQHQLLALLLLKEYFKCGYRELIEMIQLMDILQDQLMLKDIPHYSTLCIIKKGEKTKEGS